MPLFLLKANGYNHVFSSIVNKTVAYCVLLLPSLSIRHFWGKGERWKRKRERAEGEKPSFVFSPSPLPLPLTKISSPLAP